VAVVAPHFAAALLARDLGDAGPDLERTFEYALTYRRDTVVRAANTLLSRVAPRLPAPRQVPHPQHQPAPAVPAQAAQRPRTACPSLLPAAPQEPVQPPPVRRCCTARWRPPPAGSPSSPSTARTSR